MPDSVSLIVEWDNMRFADITRGEHVLEALLAQMQEIPILFDLSILYNEHAIDDARHAVLRW